MRAASLWAIPPRRKCASASLRERRHPRAPDACSEAECSRPAHGTAERFLIPQLSGLVPLRGCFPQLPRFLSLDQVGTSGASPHPRPLSREGRGVAPATLFPCRAGRRLLMCRTCSTAHPSAHRIGSPFSTCPARWRADAWAGADPRHPRAAPLEDADIRLLTYFAFIPTRYTFAGHHVLSAGRHRQAVGRGDYALLHANWMHLIVNLVWLLAFGTPVARRFGSGGSCCSAW